jgi:hypothetical protein
VRVNRYAWIVALAIANLRSETVRPWNALLLAAFMAANNVDVQHGRLVAFHALIHHDEHRSAQLRTRDRERRQFYGLCADAARL